MAMLAATFCELVDAVTGEREIVRHHVIPRGALFSGGRANIVCRIYS